ncbi:LCP family protein [Paenibacillus sp. TRM 82003]|uniref:LCP family protein n=1 Tax=Kineococcus sp. TRM81007 TaxID=2925831 RepID=UPI001F55FF08|nr:LCP family protein [Kineococcus sp. TRM81007]MCI2238340.1 LCP family protein [Kineococcus sp. TRM81007]MCI3923989.1 LCP family protein [Paenibacillus sp. TRM 82003]
MPVPPPPTPDPAQPSPRRTPGRPAPARRPVAGDGAAADGGTRALPPTGPAESDRVPAGRPGYTATTYGRPARRRPERATAQAPGREQRLAELRQPEAPARRTAPPPAHPPAHPPVGPPPPHRPQRSAARRRRRVLLVLALLVVALVVHPLALGWRGLSAVQHVATAPAGERPADTPGTTYLVVGSDSRDGMSAEELAQYSAGGDDILGRRTDTIMLLHVPESGPAALISVPRDSYVPIPGHGSGKINAAFALGGAPLLTQTVEEVSGLRVDHYVETGFSGFAHVVDAVGGVEMCPPAAVQDVRAGLDIAAGCQEMDGATALGYARYRYSDPAGDLGRAARQRELLAAIVEEATSPTTLLNPFRAFSLASAAGGALAVDEDASLGALLTFANGMRSATGQDGVSMTVPVSNPSLRTSSGLAVKWDTERALEMFADLQADDTEALRSLVP